MSAETVFARDTPLYVESESGYIDKYPRNVWLRWGVRLLAALPFLAVVAWFQIASGGDWSGTANAALAERVQDLPWGSAEVSALAALYPPISSLLAWIIPGGPLGLGIAGAVVGGTMLQLVIQSMQRKSFALPVRILFIMTLALTPLFAYVVTTSFEAVLGLTFFGIGMIDLVRFVTYANTQAGFRAGLLFACAAFSDSTGLFVAFAAGLAAAFLVRSRAMSRLANTVVVIFPTLALLGALMLLGVVFGLGPLAMIRGELQWNADRAAAVADILMSPSGLIYIAPTAVVVLTSLAMRYAGVGLVAVVLTAMILLAYIVELTPPGLAGMNYVLMLLLAVAVVPVPGSTRDVLLVCATSVVLWGLGWLQAFDTTAVSGWMAVLTGGASS